MSPAGPNWLLVSNHAAGEVNAVFVWLPASCPLHGIEPWSHLRDLLCLVPSWPSKGVLELAPANWNQTLEQSDAQQKLTAKGARALAR